MPQLDTLSFGSQIFWAAFFFFLTYFLILENFLPNLVYLLKIRQKENISASYESISAGVQNLTPEFNWNLGQDTVVPVSVGADVESAFVGDALKLLTLKSL